MRCRTAKDHFLRSRDGLLDERDRIKLQRHLASCPECAAWCGEMEECLELLGELEEIEAPDNFEWNVKRRIAMEKSRAMRGGAALPPDWTAWGRRFVAGAAAAMLIVLGGAWLADGGGAMDGAVAERDETAESRFEGARGETRFTETGYPAGIQYVSDNPIGGALAEESASGLPFRMASDQRMGYLVRENALLRRQVEELRRQNLHMRKILMHGTRKDSADR